jgi:anti-sigma-K factor RskA
VLSASRLPVAPPRTTYQLWLWTHDQPVSAGAFVPDASGTATLVTDSALNVSGPITNVAVTIEPAGGVTAPSGRTLLARLQ